jgi:hypothetical protein
MAREKKVIITTSGDRPIQDVARELADAGLKGGQVLEEIGCITGSTANGNDAVSKLRRIRGVKDVSPDVAVDVGPPGSPETW